MVSVPSLVCMLHGEDFLLLFLLSICVVASSQAKEEGHLQSSYRFCTV